MKNIIIAVIITSIICITGTVIASNYLASEVTYNNTTVEGALNDLYTIHSTYKNLNNNTTVTPQTLLNGITAYDKNGELITGSLISTDSVNSSFNANEIKTYNISTGFRPSKVVILIPNTQANCYQTFTYDSNVNNNVYTCWSCNLNVYGSNKSTEDGCTILNDFITVNNTGFEYKVVSSTLGLTYYYAIK